MEKQLYELNIDPELRDFIPPLSQSERGILTESLIEEGCNEPLVVWNGTIVDGHNRYAICHENNIPFAYTDIEFESKDMAKLWMAKKQLGRRNLKPFQRCELVISVEEGLKVEAEEGRRAKISEYRKTGETVLNLAPSKKTREIVAEMADVSPATFQMAKYIVEQGDDELKEALRQASIAISAAYKKLKKQSNSTTVKNGKKKSESGQEGKTENGTSRGDGSENKSEKSTGSDFTEHTPVMKLDAPLECPGAAPADKTPRPFQYVRDQVQFSIDNMLKELQIGLNWLRAEDADKLNELVEMVTAGFNRAEVLIKEEQQ